MSCQNVFQRVHVTYIVHGSTRVMWDLYPEFVDPLPHTFQLQVGRTGVQDADDWQNVGLPLDNSFWAVDTAQRTFGLLQPTHYRVQLTTSLGIYLSEPTGIAGVLDFRSWRLAREIVRKEKLRSRLATANGYLLKARVGGTRCPVCADLQTDEARNADCETCYGTGWRGGYFRPMPGVWADIDPQAAPAEQYEQGTLANAHGRILHIPLIEERDVWVNAATDDRFFIHKLQNIVEFRGTLPLIARADFHLAAHSHVIYTIPMDD